MKRQWKIGLCLLLAAATMSACSSGTPQNNNMQMTVETQFLGPTATPTQEPVPTTYYAPDTSDPAAGDTGSSIFSANPYDVGTDFNEYDPLNEEGYIDPLDAGSSGMGGYVAQATGTVYPYAGSTPIPLDPVDMPSPTPRPELNFTYAVYTAGSLGVTFEAPSGWQADDSQTDIFTVTEPESQMHNGQQCIITISATPVNNNYSERELNSHVTQRLKDIGAVNFVEWNPSLTATRYLMGSQGVYANYTGTLANGLELAGRIQYTCIENRLYGIEMVYPREYREDYLKIFAQIRETITRQ